MTQSFIVQQKNTEGYTEEEAIAIAKTPIWYKHSPAHGAYTIADIMNGFDPANAWMIVKYVCTTLPTGSASQYPMVLHSGSSSNSIGFRVNNSSSSAPSRLEDFWRLSSTNYSSTPGVYPTNANEYKTAIMSWDENGNSYLIVDDTFASDVEPLKIHGSGVLTTLQIGARNGGSDALVGTVLYAEIGNEYLTPAQGSARMSSIRNPLAVVTAGQSNISNWKNGVETDDPLGRAAFVQEVVANYTGELVFAQGAEGGSAIFESANSIAYWVTDELTAGPEMYDFFERIDLAGKDPDYIIWDQGESESHKVDNASWPDITEASYKTRLFQVFNLMRARYPRAKILIGILGARDTFSNTDGINKIVNAQYELIAEHSWINFGYSRHDLELNADGVHYQDAGYQTMAARAARRILAIEGKVFAGGVFGPKLVSATRSGTTLTITIEHDGGTDFTPTTAIEGFGYRDTNGTAVAVSSVVRTDATTITATLASAVPGVLHYIDDHGGGALDETKVVKDNGAYTLPLRRGYVTVS